MASEELKSIFKIFDTNADGQLNCIEMHQALGAAGCTPSVEEVQEAVKERGKDTGDLQLFLQLRDRFYSTTRYTSAQVRALLTVVDPGNEGKVEVSALQYLLTNFNERLTQAEAKEFLQDVLHMPEDGKLSVAALADALEKLQR